MFSTLKLIGLYRNWLRVHPTVPGFCLLIKDSYGHTEIREMKIVTVTL